MHLDMMKVLLALGMPAQPGKEANPTGETIKFVGMMVLMVAVFYVIGIRPQQKKAKQHATLLKTLRPGDKVLTTGGIVGVVITVKEKTVSLRSADAKFEVLKSAVSEITERSGESTQS
jgi:preprotein translocase subunit YajC